MSKRFIREVKLSSFLDKMPEAFRRHIKEITPDVTVVNIARVSNVFEVKELDTGKRQMTAYASTRRLDHDGDIVVPSDQFGCKGCNTDLYKMNPVVLLAHDYSSLPVAKSIATTPDSYGVMSHIEFAQTERGEEAWQLVKGGFLNTLSAGFMATDTVYRQDDEFTKLCDAFQKAWPEFKSDCRDTVRRIVKSWTLFEKSLVAVPANPYALVQEVAKGRIKLSQDMIKRLELDKYDPKTETEKPTEEIQKQTAPEEFVIKVSDQPIIRIATSINPVLTESTIKEMAQKIVQKSIDRKRGIVG